MVSIIIPRNFNHSSLVAQMSRRLKTDIVACLNFDSNHWHVISTTPDLKQWQVVMVGPPDTPYQHGLFTVSLGMSKGYPFGAPKIKWLTQIFHPNITSKGRYHCNLSDSWEEKHTMIDVLQKMHEDLINPSIYNPINNQKAYELYFGNKKDEFNKIAEEWTKKYAMEVTQFKYKQEMLKVENNIKYGLLKNIYKLEGSNELCTQVSLKGPNDTPYEDGIFVINIVFDKQYPEILPKIVFLTKIFHPNIDKNDDYVAKINLKNLKNKSSVCEMLENVYNMLCTVTNTSQFIQNVAKQWTLEYAANHTMVLFSNRSRSNLLANVGYFDGFKEKLVNDYKKSIITQADMKKYIMLQGVMPGKSKIFVIPNVVRPKHKSLIIFGFLRRNILNGIDDISGIVIKYFDFEYKLIAIKDNHDKESTVWNVSVDTTGKSSLRFDGSEMSKSIQTYMIEWSHHKNNLH